MIDTFHLRGPDPTGERRKICEYLLERARESEGRGGHGLANIVRQLNYAESHTIDGIRETMPAIVVKIFGSQPSLFRVGERVRVTENRWFGAIGEIVGVRKRGSRYEYELKILVNEQGSPVTEDLRLKVMQEDLDRELGRYGHMISIASELLRIARSVMAADVNTLNGIANQTAKRYVNKILSDHTKGIFHDQSWEAVRRVWKALDDNGIHWVMTHNEYHKDSPSAMPSRKQWKFEVHFVNNKGRPVTLYGVLIASGAGSVEDPLEKYDIIAYVS